MITGSGKRKALFVALTMVLSVSFTYLACMRLQPVYIAGTGFQIAMPAGAKKPDLEAERKLLLSDSLVMQVLKDSGALPAAPSQGFRGLRLSTGAKDISDNTKFLDDFRARLDVRAYPDNSAFVLEYQANDPAEAKKMLETLLQKYSDWRQSGHNPVFNETVVGADKDLIQKRENFLTSQKAFLDSLTNSQENQKAGSGLKLRQQKLAAEIDALQLRYGPKHPVLIETIREKQTIDAQLDAKAQQTKNDTLKSRMESDFAKLDEAMKASVIVGQAASGSGNNFKIMPIGDVEVRLSPQYMNYKLALAAIAGFILSCLYLFIRARIRPVFDSAQQLSKYFSQPCLATITSSDSLKMLRHELKLRATEDAPIKLVTITSTWPEEGRGDLAVSLGRMEARANERVLIIDADLRSPDLQNVIPANASRNLVDYLSGQARPEDVINRTDASGVHVIYGTAIPNTALDLISSEKMKTFLLSVREVYDLVLVVAPVSLRGPDARVLANLSDQTLYLVREGKTVRRDVRAGVQSFIEAKIKGFSFVLVK